MNKMVEYYISELLFLHDCVIIPNFGGFVGNPKSAKLNKITGVLSPPSKQILFNANLKTNDGLLITHISNQEGVSQEVAKNEVENYAIKLTNKLTNSKILRIDKIGLFTLGRENNIYFLQDGINNYSLDSFGMKATYNKAVVRETIVEEKINATIQSIHTKSNNPKAFLRVAAVMIPLIALSYISITQEDKIKDIYTQMASLNPFETNVITNPAIDIIPEIKIEDERILEVIDIEIIDEIKNEAQPIIEVIDEEISSDIIPQNTYYIIAGAFSEQKNANKLLAKLSKWNYNCEIVPGGSLLRISYNSFNKKSDALIALREIKKENSAAWILTQ